MAWDLGDKYTAFVARTEPGSGVEMDGDDGGAKLRARSIPNVSTARLRRHLAELHHSAHTAEGLRAHDDTRRSLIETSVRARMVAHELQLRGERVDCRRCRP